MARGVLTESGRRIAANGVMAGIGLQPGIVVDCLLQTSHADIYAAGDVATFYDSVLDAHRRVEHEDNANHMGKAVGRTMAGAATPYDHSPMFYSDLFELGYEAVGELDSRLETVIDWQEPFQKGVIYYLKDRRVCGVLLWNVWGKVEAARVLIADCASRISARPWMAPTAAPMTNRVAANTAAPCTDQPMA